MKKITLMLLCCITGLAYASVKDISNAPVAAKLQMDCQYSTDINYSCIIERELEVLTDQGRELVSHITIPAKESDKITILKAEYQPDNSNEFVKLGSQQIDTKLHASTEKDYQRPQITTLIFPQLNKGKKVRFRYKLEGKKPQYNPGFYHRFTFPQTGYVYSQFNVNIKADIPIYWLAKNDKFVNIQQSKDKKELTVNLKQTPYYLDYENELPESYKRDSFYLDFASSDNLLNNFNLVAKQFNQLIKQPLPVETQAVIKQAKQQPKLEQQLAVVYEYIYKNTRFVDNWQDNLSGTIGFSPKIILAHGYADSKDRVILLVALLKELGLQANIALINNNLVTVTNRSLPSIAMINTAIIKLKHKNNIYWLPPYAGNFTLSLDDRIADRDVVVINDDDRVSLERIPTKPTSKISTTLKYSNRQGSKANVSNVETYDLEPDEINDQTRTNDNTFRQIICKDHANLLVPNSCKIDKLASNFLLKDNYKLKISLTDQLAFPEIMPDIYLFSIENHEWSWVRNYKELNNKLDKYLGSPTYRESEYILMGEKLTKPRHCKFSNKWYDLSVDVKQIDNGIKIVYQEKNKVKWLTHAELISDEMQNFALQAQQCLKNMNIVIKSTK